jgi:hypothetical protein
VDNYVYTEEEVNKILVKKAVKVNLLQEKLRLVRERDMAFQEGHDEKYESLRLELERVEAALEKKKKKQRGLTTEETPLADPTRDPFSDDEAQEVKKNDKLDPFARRPTRSQGLVVNVEQSPKDTKQDELLYSPLESPGKALQKAHDFDIELNLNVLEEKKNNFQFATPSIPIEGKKFSLSDYKKIKNK